jgi:proline iminopeptidase
MKTILLILGIVLLVIVVAGGLVWYWMTGPLYQPGMVRAGKDPRAPLIPPDQANDPELWTVETDIKLYHFAAGTGRKVLIVHGGPGIPYTQAWKGLEPLTQNYQFIYYDQRGAGRSSRPIDRFTSPNYVENVRTLDRTLGLAAQIADIERIRQVLGEEKLILIGHSFGGFLASLYAAEFPERVEALILVAPADVTVMPGGRSDLFGAVRERLPQAELAGYDNWKRGYFDYGTIFSKSEADLAAMNEAFGRYYEMAMGAATALPPQGKTGGWMIQAMYFSMGQRHDYRPALHVVTAPVLVIHGADDLQSEAASRAYADAFPNAEFRLIPHANHFIFETQPEAFAAAVDAFLGK